jgi:hypothetical protein
MTSTWKQLKSITLVALASCLIFNTSVFCEEGQASGGKQFDLTCEVEFWFYSDQNPSGIDEGHFRKMFSIDLETKKYMCRAECSGGNGPFSLKSVSNQRIILQKRPADKPNHELHSVAEEINRISGEYKLEELMEPLPSGSYNYAIWSGQCKKDPFTPFSRTQF